MKYKEEITPAIVDWDVEGQPYSRQFDDIYFSAQNGLEETNHVFIKGNDLPQRWQALKASDDFCVFEAGFGTGLNFIACHKLWNNLGCPGKLHYFSVEAFPLDYQSMLQALSHWKHPLAESITEFLPAYQQIRSGLNRWAFNGNINLNLGVMDITEIAPWLEMLPPINAIFLDGFSPAKNPAMWQASLFKTLYDRSSHDVTLASYSVAGTVKRNLKAVGFSIAKRPGYGSKRDMLYAHKAAN